MSEEKCGHCKKTIKELQLPPHQVTAFFHGKDEKTNKPMMLCEPCFRKHYEMVPKKTENIFRKKKES